ncbi:MAG TPA: thioredoxin-dependent thiol peroxidase [Chloroflexota bacterium]
MSEAIEGSTAPDFTLHRSGGGDVHLQDLRGKHVVLYFYPKDDTSGCTREACGFRDRHVDLESRDAVVLGVSRDSVASHNSFAQKYNLPFQLLSDPDHRVAEAYGVWKEKRSFGKTYMGIERSTFLISPEGIITRAWRGVNPDKHADEVLAALS